jgi:hypothetical protein
MKRNRPVRILVFLVLMLARAWAQEENTPQAVPNDQGPDRPAEPAFQEGPTADNLPLSAVDEFSLVPSVIKRSLLSPGLEISQGVDSNPTDEPGTSSLRGVTRALGSLNLQKQWRRQGLDLAYLGAGTFSSNHKIGAGQQHMFSAVHRIVWRSGQLALRDSFSYLSEGSFGNGAFGGSGSLIGVGGIGTGLGGVLGGTIPGLPGSVLFGALRHEPRITDVAMIDVNQSVTSRSSFTLSGSYGLVHFIADAPISINSSQVTSEAGYNYKLSRTDQIGVTYAFERFRYPAPTNTTVSAHVANVLYGHRISERMDFKISGGPQATRIDSPLGPRWRIAVSGRVSLHYRFSRTNLALEYLRRNTNGSGLVAGAVSDVVTCSVQQPLGRKWSAAIDTGYSRNRGISAVSTATNSQSYSYWYAGAGLHRRIGRYFGVITSYQFNQQILGRSLCGTDSVCTGTTRRQSAFVGLDWHPGPVLLD